MTQEEAIKILTGYMGGKIDPESTELYHAIELVVDILESRPSLPSNLDEAAEESTKNKYPDESGLDDHDADAWYQSHRDHWRRAYKYGFKDGAAWRDAQIPKLPDNLDEVAKEYSDSMGLKGFDKVRTINDFKSGAEWMAGQGEIIEREIMALNIEGNAVLSTMFLKDDYKFGDKVVVQIRKK